MIAGLSFQKLLPQLLRGLYKKISHGTHLANESGLELERTVVYSQGQFEVCFHLLSILLFFLIARL